LLRLSTNFNIIKKLSAVFRHRTKRSKWPETPDQN